MMMGCEQESSLGCAQRPAETPELLQENLNDEIEHSRRKGEQLKLPGGTGASERSPEAGGL
jgi:hypothetical protein